MANTSIKFYKGAYAGKAADSYVFGGVYFDTDSHEIRVGKPDGSFDSFGSCINDVAWNAESKQLTISYNDGRASKSVDFSDVASATAVASALSAINSVIGSEAKPAVYYTDYAEYKAAKEAAGAEFVSEDDYNALPATADEKIKVAASAASGLVGRVAALEDAVGDTTATDSLSDRIDDVEDVIDTLTGEGAGSVKEAKDAADAAQSAANDAQDAADAVDAKVGSAAVEKVSHEATQDDVDAGKAENVGDEVIDTPASDATGLYKEIADLQSDVDGKVASISKASDDNSVVIGGTTTQPTIKVNVSAADGNALSSTDDGLYVAPAKTYSLVKLETANEGAIATYQLQDEDGVACGADIDFASDMVISSGEVRKLTEAEVEAGKGDADKDYIVLTLSNNDLLYIDAASLVDSYTAGNGIDITNNQVSVKISAAEGNKLSVDEDGALKVMVGDTVTTNAIKILGGPLADDAADNWPADWMVDGQPAIPSGLTWQETLVGLFYKVKWGTLSGPTYAWSPSLTNKPSVTLSKTSYQIVGTEATATFATVDGVSNKKASATVSISNGYGYSTDGINIVSGTSKAFQSSDGTVSGTLAATGTWNGTEIASGDTVTIVEGTNTLSVSQSGLSITPGTFTDATVYNVSNNGDVSASDKKEVSEAGFEASSAYAASKTLAAKTNSATAIGYYPYYSGLIAENVTSDDYFTEAVIKQNAVRTCPESMTTAATTNCYFIAVPEGSAQASKSQLVIMNAKETDQFGVALPCAGMVEVTVAGTAKKNYKVFYASNAAAWGMVQTFDKFTWK